MRQRLDSAPWLHFALALCVPSVFAQDALKPIRVGANSLMPMAYVSPDGEPTGFYVEVFREVARREHLQLEWVISRETADKAIETGTVDLWAVAVPTTERKAKFYLTRPWWSVSNYLATMSNSPIRGPADLAGKTVLYTTSPRNTVPFADFLPSAQMKVVESLQDRIAALCGGNADAILFYEASIYSAFSSSNSPDCHARSLRIIPIDRPVMELSIMSSLADHSLAERFRASIAEMQSEGVIEKLPSFHLTSNEQLKAELEQERKLSYERLLRFSMLAVSLLLAGSAFAYLRLRAAHRKVNDALQTAQEANRVKSEFLATMSHEIRTPMTAVLGYMQLLSTTNLRPEQEHFAREVTQATTSLLAMLTDVLDYSRSMGGAISTENSPFDPVAVIDDSIASVLLVARSKDLSISATIDPSIPAALYGDPARLRHLCLNLLSNAVKFTSQGWVSISLLYSFAESKGTLRIIVADSGIGIPPEKQEFIFLPFTQIDSTHQRSYGGIGLGLAIVSGICRQLNGTIAVTSTPGEGSTFTIELPMNPVPPHQGWLESLRLPSPATAIALWQDSQNIRILAAYLEAVGYTLKTTSSFDEWMKLADAEAGPGTLCLVDAGLCKNASCNAIAEWKTSLPGARFVLLDSAPASYDSAKSFDAILQLPVSGRAFADLLRPPSRPSFPQPLAEPMAVLVADDNAVNRRLLSSLLEQLGCRVDVAVNGQEAVEMANRRAYSLILMDCQMPVLNGFDATRQIRAGNNATVPIWGISAALEPEVRDQCLACGMTGYLAKPIAIADLHKVLNSCLPK